jgi:hypothetical protein
MEPQALVPIARARRFETTHGPNQRRNQPLIDADQEHQQARDHDGHPGKPEPARQDSSCPAPQTEKPAGSTTTQPSAARRRRGSARCHSAKITGIFRSPSGRRTMTTMSSALGSSAKTARKASRIRRRARLRCTAPPIFRDAVMPSLTGLPAGRRNTTNTRQSPLIRRPPDCTSRYSARLRTRLARTGARVPDRAADATTTSGR